MQTEYLTMEITNRPVHVKFTKRKKNKTVKFEH